LPYKQNWIFGEVKLNANTSLQNEIGTDTTIGTFEINNK
jgi:hypothetical protein